jgi:hypothetical protein
VRDQLKKERDSLRQQVATLQVDGTENNEVPFAPFGGMRDHSAELRLAGARAYNRWLVDVCALEPDRVARMMVDKGYATNYEYARQTLRALPSPRRKIAQPLCVSKSHNSPSPAK